MYKIEKAPHGVTLTFGGNMDKAEVEKWKAESEVFLRKMLGSFGVLIDMRSLKPLPPDAQKVMTDGQAIYKQKGMKRSAVILDNAVVIMQFKRLAKESGIYNWERYIDASKDSKWKQTAVDWLDKGIDPDK